MRTSLSLVAALGLTATVSSQVLVAVDSSRKLYTIDPTTGVKTQYATIGSNASTTAGLAYDAATRTMYLTSTGNDSLYALDILTGTASLIGSYGSSAFVMHGLEWDSSTNTLYGASSHDAGLYTIDNKTGLATLVGLTGLSSFVNLGYDSIKDQMYASNSGTDSFYSIDRKTGAVTLLGALGDPTNPNGLAFDSDSGTMYLVDNSRDTLYTVDLTTGAATIIGSTGSGNLLGLAYIPKSQGGVQRRATGCGSTTIDVGGVPWLGGPMTVQLGNVTGTAAIGIGTVPLSVPVCGTCTIGHEWLLTINAATLSFTVPADPSAIGISILFQGVDLGGTGGCAAPQATLTDTIRITIG